jgi:hypothetical protein
MFKKLTKLLCKHFTIVNIITALFGLFVRFWIKISGFPSIISNYFSDNYTDNHTYFIGGFSVIVAKLGIKAFVEEYIHEF